jgi:primosomal protein N' (replication factor Y) (superfamily II helicase)
LLQTSQPNHRVVRALRSGSPREAIDEILHERETSGLPPVGQLLAIETLGDDDGVDEELRNTVGREGEVFGPADAGDRSRWLVQGGALYKAKVRLRPAVQRWRDGGIRVRVDADPIDL